LQLAEARSQREEMLADLAALTSQASALQAEIDSRDEKMGGLEAAAEQAHSGLEAALGRLRELEGEQQQLEARVTLLQEENLELSTEVRQLQLPVMVNVTNRVSKQHQQL
jgi:chromosome segregation ATPase